MRKMKNIQFLSADEIKSLCETTPYPAGGALEDLLDELTLAAHSISNELKLFSDWHDRAILLFEAIYLLGVQRGGEECQIAIMAKNSDADEIAQTAIDSLDFDLLSGLTPTDLAYDLLDIEPNMRKSVHKKFFISG